MSKEFCNVNVSGKIYQVPKDFLSAYLKSLTERAEVYKELSKS